MAFTLAETFRQHPLPWRRVPRGCRLSPNDDGGYAFEYDLIVDAADEIVVSSATIRFEQMWALYSLIPPATLELAIMASRATTD